MHWKAAQLATYPPLVPVSWTQDPEFCGRSISTINFDRCRHFVLLDRSWSWLKVASNVAVFTAAERSQW
jgi:hypothetical protein